MWFQVIQTLPCDVAAFDFTWRQSSALHVSFPDANPGTARRGYVANANSNGPDYVVRGGDTVNVMATDASHVCCSIMSLSPTAVKSVLDL